MINRTSPTEVKAWCIDHGFHPNKVLGQNFLIDKNILASIVDAADLSEGDKVLEVGPGLGVMTEEMLQRKTIVTAVEKDKRLALWLTESLCQEYADSFTLITADMLEVPLQPLLAQHFDAFVANLPYSVGTRILMEVIQEADSPKTIVTLVQTEVAERFAAPVSAEERGVAGVWLQLDYDVKLVRKVSGNCFWPKPEVQSTVVAMTKHNRSTLTHEEKKTYRQLTKMAFLYRRKQLGKILRTAPKPFQVADPATLLESINLSTDRRPETLTVADWEALTRAILHQGTPLSKISTIPGFHP